MLPGTVDDGVATTASGVIAWINSPRVQVGGTRCRERSPLNQHAYASIRRFAYLAPQVLRTINLGLSKYFIGCASLFHPSAKVPMQVL
jgi:hypothetical protein